MSFGSTWPPEQSSRDRRSFDIRYETNRAAVFDSILKWRHGLKNYWLKLPILSLICIILKWKQLSVFYTVKMVHEILVVRQINYNRIIALGPEGHCTSCFQRVKCISHRWQAHVNMERGDQKPIFGCHKWMIPIHIQCVSKTFQTKMQTENKERATSSWQFMTFT